MALYRVKYSFLQVGYIPEVKYWFMPFWIQIGHYAYGYKESALHIIRLKTDITECSK